MKPEDTSRLRQHVARYRLAQLLQGLSLAGGVLAAPWHGLPAIGGGIIGAIFFHYAKPDPDERIDKILK